MDEESRLYFKEANNYYLNTQYLHAERIYRDLLVRFPGDFAIHYNLGNTYFKLYLAHRNGTNVGFLARSVYHYETARSLDPGNVDVEHNLNYIRRFLVDEVAASQGENDGFLRWIEGKGIRFRFTAGVISAISAFCLGLVILARTGVLELSRRRWFRSLGWAGLGLFGFSHLVYFSLFFLVKWSKGDPVGVVAEAQVEIYSEPREDGAVSFRLHEGTRVRIAEGTERWFRIYLPNGWKGWIKRKNLFEVKTIEGEKERKIEFSGSEMSESEI